MKSRRRACSPRRDIRRLCPASWHLGEGDGLNPHQVGYDEYFGILTVTSELSQQVDQRLYPDLLLRPDRLKAVNDIAPAEITKGRKGGPLEVDRRIRNTDDLSRLDQHFADFSDGFIRRQATAQKPFYLMHSFARLHSSDNFPAPGYAGKKFCRISPSRCDRRGRRHHRASHDDAPRVRPGRKYAGLFHQ